VRESVRGLVLLVSVLLCLPVLRPLLAGEMSADDAALRYAGALLLAWTGASLLSALVRAYGGDEQENATTDDTAATTTDRRRDDIAPDV
jgi:hypothetical protein